jgi:hypothetical protein
VAGSAQGDIYANWPVPYLFDAGGVGPGIGPQPNHCNNGDSNCGLQVFNTGFSVNSIAEQRFTIGASSTGNLSRLLSFGLQRYRYQDVNGHPQTLPDGSWLIILGIGMMGQSGHEVWLLALRPPNAAADSFDRTTFIPAAVTVAAAQLPGGTTNIISRFGYAENGTPTNAYCTSRQEECIANYTGTVPAVPFSFPSDGTPSAGEGNVAGLACASGCTLTIPAIPQRVLWHQEVYRNASNAVLGTSSWTAAVPDTLQAGLTSSTTLRGTTVAGGITVR